MELVRDLHNLKARHKGCVITIGNFDGVHIGHQAVIRQLQEYSRQESMPAVVITFEPQPLEFFNPDAAPARLTSFREKMEWLDEHGIDRVFCLRFQRSLAMMPAQEFVERILVEGMGARFIVIGDDFRFGRGRVGDFNMLRDMQAQYGFEVVPTTTLMSDGERVSSSRIRKLLEQDMLDEAAVLLGRPYSMSGRVIHGDKVGRKLGIPTANIALKRNRPPIQGVYAVQVSGIGDQVYNGVANIGMRPVFKGEQILLEIHLLDFDREIYGEHLHINFTAKLRQEKKFESVDHLVSQIHKDIEEARALFLNGNQVL